MSAAEPDQDFEAPRGFLARLRALTRLQVELIVLGGLLLFGLIGVPLLIWVAGNRVLGPYTHGQNLHGGPLDLLVDFFTGLAHGSALFWAVALGPLAMIVLLRLLIKGVRALPRTRG